MNRDDVIVVRVNADELRRIEVGAKRAGLPTSSWLRFLALAAAGEDRAEEKRPKKK